MASKKASDTLEVHRYGDRLLNVYGSSAALRAANFVSQDFVFPDLNAKGWPSKSWSRGKVNCSVRARSSSVADKNADRRTDHWWYQEIDQSKEYPPDFVEQYRRELSSS